MSAVSRHTWPLFRDLWRQVYGRDIFTGMTAPFEELMELLCGPKSLGVHDRMYDRLSSRPRTLIHGDLRADNVFRTDSATGATVANAGLTYIDFHLVHAGPPGADVWQTWSYTVDPAVRDPHTGLLRQYHETLVGLNPQAATYSVPMLVEDCALTTCLWWTIGVTLGSETLKEFDKPEGARGKRLWEKALGVMNAALIDLDCLSLIKELAVGLPDDPPA